MRRVFLNKRLAGAEFRSSNIRRLCILAIVILVIAVTHYLTDAGLLGLRKNSIHSVEYLTNFLPILLGALWYGLKGGLGTALVVSIFYIPSVVGPLGTSGVLTTTERILELVVYGGVGIITGVLSDREARRTNELIQASKELQKNRYLAALGQMVASIAHDVRNPLQSIQLNLDLLRMDLGMDSDTRMETLRAIEGSLSMLEVLVRQLLEYSKPPDLSLSATSVQALIQQALDVLRNRLANIQVYIRLDQPERELRVDSPKFVRVLINLISNAIEAMPSGGDLNIHSLFSQREGRPELRLWIEDTGTGMNEDYLEQVYEPFFTTKSSGTGLGIPISKKIIEAHGGELKISSESGKGTVVELRIPV